MTSGSGRVDVLEESEGFERTGDDSEDEAHTGEPSLSELAVRDPVLGVFTLARTALGAVDALYRRFERFPGWIRFGVGVSAFVASAYLGDDVRFVVDTFVHAVLTQIIWRILELPTGIQLLLASVAVVSLQMTVVNQRTKSIRSILETRTMTADESPLPDGGRVYRTLPKAGSGRTGALGGIVPGMVFGSLFGWGTIFGGAVLGAIVGDEIEKWYDRRRNRRKIASFVIRTLLQSPESIPVERVKSWFPSREADLVDDVLADLTSDENAPLTMVGDGAVRLTDVDAAETYLREELGLVTLPG